MLSELESVTIGNTPATALICPYDGVILMAMLPSGGYVKAYLNGTEIGEVGAINGAGYCFVTIPVKKNDSLYISGGPYTPNFARWYKTRDNNSGTNNNSDGDLIVNNLTVKYWKRIA